MNNQHKKLKIGSLCARLPLLLLCVFALSGCKSFLHAAYTYDVEYEGKISKITVVRKINYDYGYFSGNVLEITGDKIEVYNKDESGKTSILDNDHPIIDLIYIPETAVCEFSNRKCLSVDAIGNGDHELLIRPNS